MAANYGIQRVIPHYPWYTFVRIFAVGVNSLKYSKIQLSHSHRLFLMHKGNCGATEAGLLADCLEWLSCNQLQHRSRVISAGACKRLTLRKQMDVLKEYFSFWRVYSSSTCAAADLSLYCCSSVVALLLFVLVMFTDMLSHTSIKHSKHVFHRLFTIRDSKLNPYDCSHFP